MTVMFSVAIALQQFQDQTLELNKATTIVYLLAPLIQSAIIVFNEWPSK